MKITRVLLMLFPLVMIYPAQAVTISGTVKINGGSALEGVKVRLGKAAIMTTTGADGSFSLRDLSTDCQPHRPTVTDRCSFLMEDNKIYFSTEKRAEIKTMIYDCNGRLFASQNSVVSVGNHSMALPRFGRGMHIYCISINNEVYTFKSVTGIAANRNAAASWKEINLAKLTKATTQIDDALLFIKAGYQLSRIVIKKPDTSGLQITMAPLDTGSLTDADGNVYKTVRIGNQYWTTENLRVTKYTDGTSIGTDLKFYNNITDAAAKKKWGGIYSLNAATSSKLAPTGWKVPSRADWDTLQKYLISHGYNYDGTTTGNKIAKSMAATTDWDTTSEVGGIGNDLSLNNASGFSALPGGWIYWGANNSFTAQGSQGYWYSSYHSPSAEAYPYGYIYMLWWINATFDNYDGSYVSCSLRLVKHI